MFAPDIVSLRQFYASNFGKAAENFVGKALRELWPQVNPDDTVLGIGYCAPYFEDMGHAGLSLVCMPAHQGAAYWPVGGANRVFLSHESDLPLPDNSVNRVLLVHSIEHTETLSWMIEDIWRVLTPGGRVIAVVPNRLGSWSRSSRSPFGYGRPFNMAQLRDLMTRHQFTLTGSRSALFMPPLRIRLLWRVADKIERLGRLLFPFFGGVLLVEAEKQLYASIREPVAVRKRAPALLTAPATVLGLKRQK